MELFPLYKYGVASLILCSIIAFATIPLSRNGVASLLFYNCVCEYTSRLRMELFPLFCVLQLHLRVCLLSMEFLPLYKYGVASLILCFIIAFANILIV